MKGLARKVYLGAAQDASELNQLLKGYRVPSVAVVARSNTGKSSLINAILGGKYAIVSKTPGRTKLAHSYLADGFTLIDLPGYGHAKGVNIDEAQKMANIIAECVIEREETGLVLVLSDVRRMGYTDLDWKMIETLRKLKIPYETVITKIDRATKDELLKADLQLPDAWLTSSKNNVGIKELKAFLKSLGEVGAKEYEILEDDSKKN